MGRKRKEVIEDLIRKKPKYPNQKLCVTIPLGISVNHLYIFKRGKRFMTQKGQKYIQKVMKIVANAVEEQEYKLEEEGVWLVAEMRYWFPDKRRRDCHNMHKIVMDSLEYLAFKEDRWVLVEDKFVGLDKKNPRIEVTIKPMNYNEAMKEVKR